MSDHTHATHGYGFDEHGHAVAISDFPHDEVSARIDGTPEQAAMDAMRRSAASQALDRTLWVLLVPRPRSDSVVNWKKAAQTAGTRTIALAYVIRHRTTSEVQSLVHLSQLSGIQWDALRRAAVMVSREFGIPLEIVRKYKRSRSLPA